MGIDIKTWYYKDGGGKVFEFAKKRSHQQILWSEKMKNSKKCGKGKKLVE